MRVVPVEEQQKYGVVVGVTEQPAPASGVVVGVLTEQPGASSGGAARGVVDQTLAMLDGLADEGGRGSLESLGRWNEKRYDRAMPVKLKAESDAETMVRVALGKLVDELVQTNASSGILAISCWSETRTHDKRTYTITVWGFSWSASPDDTGYQRHGFVGMQSDQRQNIRFADFEGVVDDFGALGQIAVYRVTLPSGGLGLNWTPKRHGTVSPALAERIKVALLCAVRDRKRPHKERSLALLPNRILIHNIFSYLADVNSVKWVGRPPPPAP